MDKNLLANQIRAAEGRNLCQQLRVVKEVKNPPRVDIKKAGKSSLRENLQGISIERNLQEREEPGSTEKNPLLVLTRSTLQGISLPTLLYLLVAGSYTA
jgi:hypothetical protein